MSEVWDFLGSEDNRKILTWFGSGILAVLAFLFGLRRTKRNAKKEREPTSQTSHSSGTISNSGNISGQGHTVSQNFWIMSGPRYRRNAVILIFLAAIVALAVLAIRARANQPLPSFNLSLACTGSVIDNPYRANEVDAITALEFLDFLERNNSGPVFVRVSIIAQNGAGECSRVIREGDAADAMDAIAGNGVSDFLYFGKYPPSEMFQEATEGYSGVSEIYVDELERRGNWLNVSDNAPYLHEPGGNSAEELFFNFTQTPGFSNRVPEEIRPHTFSLEFYGGARGVNIYLPRQQYISKFQPYKTDSTSRTIAEYEGVFVARYFDATVIGGFLEVVDMSSPYFEAAKCNRLHDNSFVARLVVYGCLSDFRLGPIATDLNLLDIDHG